MNRPISIAVCFTVLIAACATEKSDEPIDLFQGISGKKHAEIVDADKKNKRAGIDVSVSCKDTVKVTFSAQNRVKTQYKYKIGNATDQYILKQGSGKITDKNWSLTVNVEEAQQGHVYAARIEVPGSGDSVRSYTSCQ